MQETDYNRIRALTTATPAAGTLSVSGLTSFTAADKWGSTWTYRVKAVGPGGTSTSTASSSGIKLDTTLMRHFGERVFCKVGAEGVYCAALPGLGLGLALKMDDGNTSRACEVALVHLVEKLLPASSRGNDDADHVFLAPLRDVALRNWNGRPVARLSPARSW